MGILRKIGYEMENSFKYRGSSSWLKDESDAWNGLVMCKG